MQKQVKNKHYPIEKQIIIISNQGALTFTGYRENEDPDLNPNITTGNTEVIDEQGIKDIEVDEPLKITVDYGNGTCHNIITNFKGRKFQGNSC